MMCGCFINSNKLSTTVADGKAIVARKKEIFCGKKGLLTRQTEAMFMKKSKFQSYLPINWHNASKLHTWSEISIMF